MPPRLLRLAVFCAALLLPACQTPAPPPPHAQPSYAHLGPIAFDVARIEVTSPYQSPLAPPHVEHLSPTPPEQAVRRWAADRLRATGTNGVLRVIIRDASITEAPLPVTPGLKGQIRNEQATRLDARLDVELAAEVPATAFAGYTRATVERSTTLPEDVSLYERERAMLRLVEEMMRDLNYRLETGALNNLALLIRR